MDRLRNINLFLFDMDGTLYLGDSLFDFTPALLSGIKAAGKRYMFMTNNSYKSVNAYVEKLKRLGIEAEKDDFITSSQATAIYLKKHYPAAALYVCGTQSLKDELAGEGFEITEDLARTDCIVMGFDTELTFKKLHDISYMLTTRDIPYIATNPDYVCPTEFGYVPDCGSVCDMIFNATGKRPTFIGKPEAAMPLLAMDAAGYGREETAVIGDRIYTDIKSGLAAGALSVLVMSGESTQKTLDESPDKPDLVLNNAGEIIPYLN